MANESKKKKEGVHINGKDIIYLNAPKVFLSKDTPLNTKAQDIAGAINELFNYDAGGGDDEDDFDNANYSFINDPDWELFKNTPEPAYNQLIFAIRIVDPSFRQAGTYYTEYYQSSPYYAANQDTAVNCNIKIDLPRQLNYFEDENLWEFPSYEIDWGDGTVTSHPGGVGNVSTQTLGADGYDGGTATTSCHVYEEAGTYIVTCTLGLVYPKTNLEVGGYAVRVHKQNQPTNFVANAPITVFAKVGEGFARYAVGSGNNYYPSGQIHAFGMNRTIKFLSGNFAKLGFSLIGCNSLKYIKTDAIRAEAQYCSKTDGAFVRTGITDFGMSNDYCLELIDIKGNTYSGICHYMLDINSPIRQASFYTTNEIQQDSDSSKYNGSFQNCYALKKLPNEILNIREFNANNVFAKCFSLTSISMPECVTLGTNAFSQCKSLKKISLPKLENIPQQCFYSCGSLIFVDIPNCVTIGNNAFSDCVLLSEISFDKCETIGSYAIPSGTLSRLKKISLPKCTAINFTCQNNYALSEVNCPSCINVVSYAFQNCYSLCIFNVAENCTFGSNVFNGCLGLYPRPDGSVN